MEEPTPIQDAPIPFRLAIAPKSLLRSDEHRELNERLIDVLALTGLDFFNSAIDFINAWIGDSQAFIYLQCPERKLKLIVKGNTDYWSSDNGKKILKRFITDVLPAAVPMTEAAEVPFLQHLEGPLQYWIIPFEVDSGSCCVLTLLSARPISLPHKFEYAYRIIGRRIAHEANQLFAQEKIRKIAFNDHLTGLANRRILENHIDILLGLSRRNGKKMAILFIDLDNFKEINDLYGHQVGDIVLVEFARLLKSRCRRKSDMVARYGGDEFIILLSGVERIHEPVALANGLLAGLDSFYLRSDVKMKISASIGISTFPDCGETSADLIASADKALYEAKNSGKGKCIVFHHEMPEVNQ